MQAGGGARVRFRAGPMGGRPAARCPRWLWRAACGSGRPWITAAAIVGLLASILFSVQRGRARQVTAHGHAASGRWRLTRRPLIRRTRTPSPSEIGVPHWPTSVVFHYLEPRPARPRPARPGRPRRRSLRRTPRRLAADHSRVVEPASIEPHRAEHGHRDESGRPTAGNRHAARPRSGRRTKRSKERTLTRRGTVQPGVDGTVRRDAQPERRRGDPSEESARDRRGAVPEVAVAGRKVAAVAGAGRAVGELGTTSSELAQETIGTPSRSLAPTRQRPFPHPPSPHRPARPAPKSAPLGQMLPRRTRRMCASTSPPRLLR